MISSNNCDLIRWANCCLHLTSQETEAQGGCKSCLMLSRQKVVESGFEPNVFLPSASLHLKAILDFVVISENKFGSKNLLMQQTFVDVTCPAP